MSEAAWQLVHARSSTSLPAPGGRLSTAAFSSAPTRARSAASGAGGGAPCCAGGLARPRSQAGRAGRRAAAKAELRGDIEAHLVDGVVAVAAGVCRRGGRL